MQWCYSWYLYLSVGVISNVSRGSPTPWAEHCRALQVRQTLNHKYPRPQILTLFFLAFSLSDFHSRLHSFWRSHSQIFISCFFLVQAGGASEPLMPAVFQLLLPSRREHRRSLPSRYFPGRGSHHRLFGSALQLPAALHKIFIELCTEILRIRY